MSMRVTLMSPPSIVANHAISVSVVGPDVASKKMNTNHRTAGNTTPNAAFTSSSLA